MLKTNIIRAEEIEVKVFANPEKSLSHIKILIKNVFLLNLHALLMSFKLGFKMLCLLLDIDVEENENKIRFFKVF